MTKKQKIALGTFVGWYFLNNIITAIMLKKDEKTIRELRKEVKHLKKTNDELSLFSAHIVHMLPPETRDAVKTEIVFQSIVRNQ